MNEITAVFVLIVLSGMVAHAINIIVLMNRWQKIKKGIVQKSPFIKRINTITLWIATMLMFVAIILFCVFFEIDKTGKLKLFLIILINLPFKPQPIGAILVAEYILLFNRNRRLKVGERELDLK